MYVAAASEEVSGLILDDVPRLVATLTREP
jgi:hypothetical protein